MVEKTRLNIDAIRVPGPRKKTLKAEKVEELAHDILENGQSTPISVRRDGEGFILIEGYHRLEALRALGEDEIDAYLVRPKLH